MRLNSPQPAGSGRWKNDVVNQQLKELKMNKIKLFAVKPSDSRNKVYKKLIEYLEYQGIKIKKERKHEKK